MDILTRVKVSSSSLVALKSHVATCRLRLLPEKTPHQTQMIARMSAKTYLNPFIATGVKLKALLRALCAIISLFSRDMDTCRKILRATSLTLLKK